MRKPETFGAMHTPGMEPKRHAPAPSALAHLPSEGLLGEKGDLSHVFPLWKFSPMHNREYRKGVTGPLTHPGPVPNAASSTQHPPC